MSDLARPEIDALMREMGLNDGSVERRRKYVGLDAADLRRMTALKPLVTERVELYVRAFFDALSALDEGAALLANPELANRARALKRAHLLAMTEASYGLKYAEERMQLGALYARAGVDARVFLGAYHHMLRAIGDDVMRASGKPPGEAFDAFMSLEKVSFFDVSLIVDALVVARERVIRQQQEAIRELSTPVLQIRERLLLLPIIGVVDTHRARLITEGLLHAIRQNRAKVVVMDVTGVATIDSRAANHLLQTVTAARLMGARVIVSGITSEVAQSLVALGIELGRLNTVGDLQGGLEEADRILAAPLALREDVDDARDAS
jgi:rsbT co-antagonist protein RsbR